MLADAPWIREAENDGMPDGPDPKCPLCGQECSTLYVVDGEVLGCENCVETVDAYDWTIGRG